MTADPSVVAPVAVDLAVFRVDHLAIFSKKPTVGVNGDNIYTMQSGYTALDALLGQQPADFRGPLTNTDSVIVP